MKVFEELGEASPAEDWVGIDPVLPLLERMRQEGAVVVMKLDGERRSAEDNGPYTVVVSGVPLAGDYLKAETRSIEEALTRVILDDASRCWKR
ncbi:hypothetical protein [Corallococcus silvisoli]|uniref:hypothetical protein n=1 Tax=Corallococcus silvisoli TaxID=2697031 RepID=UPI001377A25F|nr:hypothetical protein [Corallococcus silvisoli]NBD12868.1 hypothetical protein [Corallococcus silvisoli]